jgi:selenide,water dikinase
MLIRALRNGSNRLTDVTGFGLMGHLLEVCEGSNVSAIVNYSKVPVKEIHDYIDKKCVPGGTKKLG